MWDSLLMNVTCCFVRVYEIISSLSSEVQKILEKVRMLSIERVRYYLYRYNVLYLMGERVRSFSSESSRRSYIICPTGQTYSDAELKLLTRSHRQQTYFFSRSDQDTSAICPGWMGGGCALAQRRTLSPASSIYCHPWIAR